MNEILAWGIILLFLLILVIGGRYFYGLMLQPEARRLARRHGLNVYELACPFEQIIYFVSMPSQVPEIRHADKGNLVIKPDYRSLLFPQLAGLKIFIRTGGEPILLAYLAMKDFRLVTLDQLLEQKAIGEAEYRKLAACKLIHPSTLEEISDEVSQQIQRGRKVRQAV